MRKLMVMMFVGVLLSGCNNLGDGQVDAVDAGVVRVAVNTALRAMPESAGTVYAVASALVATLDGNTAIPLEALNSVVEVEVASLGLLPADRKIIDGFIFDVRGQIVEVLNSGGGDVSVAQKRVVVLDVLTIIRDASGLMLGSGNG